jgi:hypothetical protein
LNAGQPFPHRATPRLGYKQGAYYFHFDGIKIALTCGFSAVLDESLRWLLNGAPMKWFRLSAMLLTFFMTCGTAFAHGAGMHLPHFGKSKQGKSYGTVQYRVVGGQLQRSKKPATLRSLNKNHNHDLKDIFKGCGHEG